MRIIKQGIRPEDRVIRATRYHCKAEVEFKQGEGTRYSDFRETHYSVPCPVCNKSIAGYPPGNQWGDR